MDSKQIDVMVADASHEVYVDKILRLEGNPFEFRHLQRDIA